MFGVVAAAVDLQTDAAGVGMAFLGFGPFHEFHAVDPGGDGGRVMDDAGAQLVPLAVPPEEGPGFRQDRQGGWRVRALNNNGDFVGEAEVQDGGFGAEFAFAVYAHEVAAGVIVDHGLVGGAVLGAAQEEAAVGAEVVVHLEDDFVVAVFLVGEEDAAVAGNVLAADDGAVLDDPAAAGLVFAGAAVAGLGAGVPAGKGFAVEDGDEAIRGGLGEGGESGG